MKNKRIISSIILMSVLTIVLLLGNTTVLNILISAVAIIALNEYFNSFKDKKNVDKYVGFLLAGTIAFLDILETKYLMIFFIVAIVLLFLKVIVSRHENKL